MSSTLVAAEASNPQVFEKVRETFVEALGVEPDEVSLKARVIDDLGAESLDFLDIAYRLEQSFKISPEVWATVAAAGAYLGVVPQP